MYRRLNAKLDSFGPSRRRIIFFSHLKSTVMSIASSYLRISVSCVSCLRACPMFDTRPMTNEQEGGKRQTALVSCTGTVHFLRIVTGTNDVSDTAISNRRVESTVLGHS